MMPIVNKISDSRRLTICSQCITNQAAICELDTIQPTDCNTAIPKRNEDKLDKPWRPVPSGRVSVEQVRRILSAACLVASFVLGRFVFGASLGVTLYTILYGDLLVFRNLCIAAGYLASDIGTLTITSESSVFHHETLDKFSNYIFHLLLQNRWVGWTG